MNNALLYPEVVLQDVSPEMTLEESFQNTIEIINGWDDEKEATTLGIPVDLFKEIKEVMLYTFSNPFNDVKQEIL